MSSFRVVSVREMLNSAWPFAVVGGAAILIGGLLSAVTARSTSYHLAWVVAYLVLVVGVAQIALGAGQAAATHRALGTARIAGELALFNFGSVGVIAGTFSSQPLLVDAGSALMIAALVVFAQASWRSSASRWMVAGFRILIGFLALSVLVGVALAHTTTG